MILCLCSGIDNNTIIKFLQKNRDLPSWEKFLIDNNLTKDCGSCFDCIDKLRTDYLNEVNQI
jgi:bacterioferritin-associated ferredoxin